MVCVACHPLSTLLVSGGFDETIRLWDIQRGTCHRTIAAHSEGVTSVDFSSDGSMIASCAYDGLMCVSADRRLWDTSEGHCLRTLQHTDMAPVSFVQFSPSSMQLLTASLDSAVRLWDLPNARVLRTYVGHANEKYPLTAAFVVRDDRVLIASGSEDRQVHLWDMQTSAPFARLAGHRDVVIVVRVRPLLTAASRAPACRLRRARAGRDCNYMAYVARDACYTYGHRAASADASGARGVDARAWASRARAPCRRRAAKRQHARVRARTVRRR